MRFLLILSSVLIFSGDDAAESDESSGCCYKRIVSEYEEGLEGEFTFTRTGAQDPLCAEGCVYRRSDGGTFAFVCNHLRSEDTTEREYCFRAVTDGAANIQEECEKSTSSSTSVETTGPTSEQSTVSSSVETTSDQTGSTDLVSQSSVTSARGFYMF